MEWEKRLGKKHIRSGFKDDSDIWDGEKFVENVFAKKEKEEKEKTMKSLPRPRLRPSMKNNDTNLKS